MKLNPWRDCKKDPPNQYTRVEIRNKSGERFLGYRYSKDYYETYGNYLIKNPMSWRYPPKGSKLLTELKEKLYNIIIGDTEYGYERR